MSQKIDKTLLGKRLQAIRKQHGLSQSAFAEMAGVSTTTVSEVERGLKKMNVEILIALASLGYEISEVVRGEEESPPMPQIVVPDPFAEAQVNSGHSVKGTVADRLRQLAETERFDGLSGLARAAGLQDSELAAILVSNDIDEETAARICESLAIRLQWLLTGEGPSEATGSEIHGMVGYPSDEAAQRITAIRSARDAARTQLVWVPLAHSRLGAGGVIISVEGTESERYAFPAEVLASVGANPEKVVLVQVEGSSMVPDLEDGDLVLVDLTRTEVVAGRIYAIAVGDALQVKRLDVLPGNRLRVQSSNPTAHSYSVDPSEIKVVGQVIWYSRFLVR